jgi:hypothetical protein
MGNCSCNFLGTDSLPITLVGGHRMATSLDLLTHYGCDAVRDLLSRFVAPGSTRSSGRVRPNRMHVYRVLLRKCLFPT